MHKLVIDLDEKGLLTIAAVKLLNQQLVQALSDPSCPGVMLTGVGRFFCCGLLISDSQDEIINEFEDLLVQLFSSKKPVVVYMNGHAVGGGLLIAACADYVYANESPRIKIGLPEMNVGFHLTPLMVNVLGYRFRSRKDIQEMLYTGEFLNPSEMRSLGLVDGFYSAEEIYDAAEGSIAQLLRSGPEVFELNKMALKSGVLSS